MTPITSSAWLAGNTIRWHRNPHLSGSNDRVDGHSARVAFIILRLEPNPSAALLKMALIHDLGESGVGDIAYPVKLENPDLNVILERLEAKVIEKMGFEIPTLTSRESELLEIADKLDAYLWALHHMPSRVMSDGRWMVHRQRILRRAEEANVRLTVDQIIAEVSHGSW